MRVQGLRLLTTGESMLLRITPEADEPASTAEGLLTVGNPCLSGGTLEIFMEAVMPPTLVHVFGAAPVAQALTTVAAAVGYDVRASTDPDEPIPPDAEAVVVASHGRGEEPVLAAALKAGVGYVALVASHKRGEAVLAELDVPEEQRLLVHSPAGLDIGARGAHEVALSVLAEFIAQRPRRDEACEAEPTEPSAPAEAVDPVCGMSVAMVASSLRLEHAGVTWYFCGSGCRQAFADDPARYAA